MMGTLASALENMGLKFFPPRHLFMIGALARGVHLSSSLAYTLNPSVGACALVNIGSAIVRERWIPRLVSGWVLSSWAWRFFGAEPPPRVLAHRVQ